MAKKKEKTTPSAAETEQPAAPASTDTTAAPPAEQAAGTSDVRELIEQPKPKASAKNRATGFRVKHGSVYVGPSDERKTGASIAEDELSEDDRLRLIADGTIERWS